MYDLATNEESIELARAFAVAGKPIAAVCHGPAAFLNVTLPNGKHLLDGRTVTAFSNAEEEAIGALKEVLFHLETELSKVSGQYVKADQLWGEKVVTDGNIITGQNPASSKAIGKALVKALGL
jgi:putative intracellular protease/amidase